MGRAPRTIAIALLASTLVSPIGGAVAAVPVIAGDLHSTGTLSWSDCASKQLKDFECARLEVPRNWADASVGTFSLAVARHRSTGTKSERIGSLFFNPGGPGGSGLETITQIWSLLPDESKRRFDLVTWDPRGIGSSTPAINCELTVWDAPPATGDVDWVALAAGVRARVAQANTDCLKANADVAPYIGTVNAARDLDALRAAVGDTQLNYWAMSYGTRIGYTYALLYPKRFRTIVMDGSVSPRGSIAQFAEGYGAAADPAIGLLFQRFPGTATLYRRVSMALERQPLQLTADRQYTRWDLSIALESNASSQANAAKLAEYLGTVEQAIFGSPSQKRAAKRTLAKYPATITFSMSGIPSFVNCLDYADRLDAPQQDAFARATRQNAPITGWYRALQMNSMCDGLEQLAPDPVPYPEGSNWSARVLMLGGTRDSQTPYAWTTSMANFLRAGRVVSYVSNQHVIYGVGGSECVDDAASAYLIRRALPRTDIACDLAARP